MFVFIFVSVSCRKYVDFFLFLYNLGYNSYYNVDGYRLYNFFIFFKKEKPSAL